MFFVQWLFANHYSPVTSQEALKLFSFEENFDYLLFEKLEKTYSENSQKIESLVGESNVVSRCIISMGICEIISGVESALAISECLKISDLFCDNSAYINGVLERISNRMKKEEEEREIKGRQDAEIIGEQGVEVIEEQSADIKDRLNTHVTKEQDIEKEEEQDIETKEEQDIETKEEQDIETKEEQDIEIKEELNAQIKENVV
jgi:transcription termination factor NusB